MIEKLYYCGFIANADVSITKVKLDHGFSIREIDIGEVAEFIAELENIHPKTAYNNLVSDLYFLDSTKPLARWFPEWCFAA